jgi:hypothetical protein
MSQTDAPCAGRTSSVRTMPSRAGDDGRIAGRSREATCSATLPRSSRSARPPGCNRVRGRGALRPGCGALLGPSSPSGGEDPAGASRKGTAWWFGPMGERLPRSSQTYQTGVKKSVSPPSASAGFPGELGAPKRHRGGAGCLSDAQLTAPRTATQPQGRRHIQDSAESKARRAQAKGGPAGIDKGNKGGGESGGTPPHEQDKYR